MNINMSWAIAYAEIHGFSVIPIHSINEFKKCSCNNTTCTSPGKHPIINGGFKSATTDLKIIEKWWTQYPNANIGIATGKISKCVVLDIDPRNGGLDSFKTIQHLFGNLKEIPTVKTGGNGFHYYFAYTANVRCRSGILPGIDIKSDGGYVVAPPSSHLSGQDYAAYNCWEII